MRSDNDQPGTAPPRDRPKSLCLSLGFTDCLNRAPRGDPRTPCHCPSCAGFREWPFPARALAPRRSLDFFAASIGNDNTRLAYYRAVCSFFAWLEQHGIGGLIDIEPFRVAAYIKALNASDAG